MTLLQPWKCHNDAGPIYVNGLRCPWYSMQMPASFKTMFWLFVDSPFRVEKFLKPIIRSHQPDCSAWWTLLQPATIKSTTDVLIIKWWRAQILDFALYLVHSFIHSFFQTMSELFRPHFIQLEKIICCSPLNTTKFLELLIICVVEFQLDILRLWILKNISE